jgi:hypothetical protein
MRIPKVISNKAVIEALKKVTEKKSSPPNSLTSSFTQVEPEDFEDDEKPKGITQSMMLDTSQISDFKRTPEFHSFAEDRPDLIIEKLEGFDVNSMKSKKNVLSMEKLDELDLSILDTSHLKPSLDIEKQGNLMIKAVKRKQKSRKSSVLKSSSERNQLKYGWTKSLSLGVLGALIITKKVMFRKFFTAF